MTRAPARRAGPSGHFTALAHLLYQVAVVVLGLTEREDLTRCATRDLNPQPSAANGDGIRARCKGHGRVLLGPVCRGRGLDQQERDVVVKSARETSVVVAAAVARAAEAERVASARLDADLARQVRALMWEPRYLPVKSA